MKLTPLIKSLNIRSINRAIQAFNSNVGPESEPTFGGLTLTGLTPNRLVQTDADNAVVSVSNLANWIAGTTNEIDITDDGDGTITIGIVNPLIVGKGGTGLATLTDHSLLVGSGTDAITPLGVATNGQLPIGSTGADPVLAALTGTSNQIVVTNAAGSITLSLPQDIHTGASPTFAGLSLGSGTLEAGTITGTSLKIPQIGGTAGKFSIFQGGSNTTDLTYTLPTAYPISVSQVLQSTTAGILSWVTPAASVSFGTTTQIPYMNVAGTDFLYSANLVFDGTNLTCLGTVQAEQLTSTDDITMTGKFLNTMAAADTLGLVVDGDTNPFTYAGNFEYLNSISRTINGSGTTTFPSVAQGIGTQRKLIWNYDFSGTGTQMGSARQVAAASDYLLFSGDITVSGAGFISPLLSSYGGYSLLNRTGAVSNSSSKNLTLTDRGVYYGANLASAVNRTSTGTITINVIGGEFTTGSSVSLVNGSSDVVFNYYGGKFLGVGTTTGTSIVYGGYFSGTGGDTNWGIYNAAGEAFMGVDNAKSYWGTSNDLQIYHNGSNSYIYNDTGILKIQDAGSGINLGTAITELLGFYGVTPVDQPATVADPTDLPTCITAISVVIDRLQELGLVA